MREEFGVEPAKNPDDHLYYVRPNGYQAVFVNRNGAWYAPVGPDWWVNDYGPFPWNLEGLSFEGVAHQVRDLATVD
jgi:hypothetical protein